MNPGTSPGNVSRLPTGTVNLRVKSAALDEIRACLQPKINQLGVAIPGSLDSRLLNLTVPLEGLNQLGSTCEE